MNSHKVTKHACTFSCLPLATQCTTYTMTLQLWTNNKTNKSYKQLIYIYINISCKCDTNRAGHLTLDAYASRPVACTRYLTVRGGFSPRCSASILFLSTLLLSLFWCLCSEFMYYTMPAKILNIWKAQCKHSYLKFWLAGNGLVPTKNNYCDFNSALTWTKMQLAISEIKDTQKNLQEYVIFLILRLKFPTTSGVCIIIFWIYGNCVCVFNNS